LLKELKEKELLFKNTVKIEAIVLTCTKDTHYDTIRKFISSNLYIPEYYNYSSIDRETYVWGISELIHNSIRASSEKDTTTPIKCVIEYTIDWINFQITNGAGGFDFNKILYKPGKKLEAMSQESHSYHERTGRGGFGLYIASKMFGNFNITFYNENEEVMEFTEGKTKGTRINFVINREEPIKKDKSEMTLRYLRSLSGVELMQEWVDNYTKVYRNYPDFLEWVENKKILN